MEGNSDQLEEHQKLPYVAILDAEPGLADPKEARLNFET